MLHNEYDRLRQFSHAKLIAVKGITTWNNTPVLLREYFEGQPLDQFLNTHSLTEHQCLHLAVAIVEAVQSIHDAGCIHTQS
ncbi:protein kinase domain-containing protein [Nitrincola alkalisediminis]|uniref:protein kinase domain-containing protein n=1 Tax=Nitrincola alkalisediminis TaxID=1366656 RepID=UPI001875879D|nr:protein kinase [Nitrincola alkalisediminis]